MTETPNTGYSSMFPEAEDVGAITISKLEISQILPHKGPALMIDEARFFESEKRIVAIYYVSPQNPLFEGHFPDKPILKGVEHVEIAGQAAALLVGKMLPEMSGLPYFSKIRGVEFKRPINPGDMIAIEVRLMQYNVDNPRNNPFEFLFTITKKAGKFNKEASNGSFTGVIVK